VVVAPLRLARGLQNKVLEAMAMARPVVAAQACVEAISAKAGQELLAADQVDDYVRAVDGLLRDQASATAVGLAGRQRVIDDYGWTSQLAVMDRYLDRHLHQHLDQPSAQDFGRAPVNRPASLSAQTA
jgi:glycosyltransferase involved in cell wall biosynthesis